MVPELDKPVKAELPSGLSPDEVRAALDKISTSSAFSIAERPARFLRHLVEAALRGDYFLLKESLLGIDVFERPADWDPRETPIVRQEAARLRKRLTRYYETDGIDDKVRIELPVGAYVPVFQRTGQAPAPNAPAPAPRRRWWPYAAATVILIAGAALAWRATHLAEPLSIAVLPFTNLSGDPADQYFVNGTTDEVTDSLARLKPLRVAARSSAALFKKEPRNLQDIARQLRVSHLLQASVERSGDRLNVVATLVRASDGATIWTNTYRRQLADLAVIGADLAEGVRSSLGVVRPAANKEHIPPSEAHDFYLKARFESVQDTPKDNAQAQVDFRRALSLDPDYAYAYSGLAVTIWNESIVRNQRPTFEQRRMALELWQKAVELDPGQMSAHSGLGAHAMQYDWDWDRAERELQAANATQENWATEGFYAELCLVRGRRAEAEQHRRRANDLDSISPTNITNNAQFLQLVGRLAEARAETLKVSERSIGAKLRLNTIIAAQGQPEEAIKNLLALPQEPNVQLILAYAKAKAGASQEALRLLASLEEHYQESHLRAGEFAAAYAALDDEPSTIKWLTRSMDAREFIAIYIPVNPDFAKMQNRPAFRALKKRMNLDW